MSQFGGMRKRPWLGGLMGQDRGEIGGGGSLPNPFTGGLGAIAGNVIGRISGHQPGVGDRNPLPGWPGDAPISDGQGGMTPVHPISYRNLPGFSTFSRSNPDDPYYKRRFGQIDISNPLQYKDPAMLQQLSDATMAFRGTRQPGRSFGGQGYGEGYPGDALKRLLQARLGGGM